MKCKQLGLRVLSTAAIMSIVSSIAAPAFAGTYYLGESGAGDITITANGEYAIVKRGDTVIGKENGKEQIVIKGGTGIDQSQLDLKDTQTSIGESSPVTQESKTEETPVVTEEEEQPEETAEETPEEPEQEEETPAEGEAAEESKEEPETQEQPEEKAQEEKPVETEEKADEPEETAEEEQQEETEEPAAEPTGEQEEQEQPKAEEQTEEKQETQVATMEAQSTGTPVAQSDEDSDDATSISPVNNVISVINNWVDKILNITLDNVNIKSTNNAALSATGKGKTTIELDGNNVLDSSGSYGHAGLEVGEGSDVTITDSDGTVNADGTVDDRATLTATGGNGGAGIGGAINGQKVGNITINGTAEVTATGSSATYGGGAGIGTGGISSGNLPSSSVGDITIGDNTLVKASGIGSGSTGIGGSYKGEVGNITIIGNADVTAAGSAVGIGSGSYTSGATNVAINDHANVTATGGTGIGSGSTAQGKLTIKIQDNAKVDAVSTGAGAAIGSGSGCTYGIGGASGGVDIIIGTDGATSEEETVTVSAKQTSSGGGAVIGAGFGNKTLGDTEVNIIIQGGAKISEVRAEGNSTVAIGGGDSRSSNTYGNTVSGSVKIKDNAIVEKLKGYYGIGFKADNSRSTTSLIEITDNAHIGAIEANQEGIFADNITLGNDSDSVKIDDIFSVNALDLIRAKQDLSIGKNTNIQLTQRQSSSCDEKNVTTDSQKNNYAERAIQQGNTNITKNSLQTIFSNAGTGKIAVRVKNYVQSGNKWVEKLDEAGNPVYTLLYIAHGENYCEGSDGTVTKPATCTEEGTIHYDSCTYEKNQGAVDPVHSGGFDKVLAKDPSNHVTKTGEPEGTILKNAKPATCTEIGYTGDVVCKGCDAVITPGTVIPATNHEHTHVINAKAATCTDDGYTGDTYCDDCQKTIATGTVIEKLNHNWDEGTITTAPTCTEPGVRTYTCQNDASHTYTEPVPATGHQHTHIEGQKDATDTEPGYTGDTVCDDCGAVIGKGKEIPATGHQHTEVVGAKDPTCTEPGYTGDTVCKDCGEIVKKGEVIPATGHQHTHIENQKDATETEPGYTGDTVCDDCGAVIGKGESIPAKGVPADENNEKVSTPELWVIAPDTIRQTFTVRQNGTERIYTSPYNSGTLTGTMEILQYLQEQGVETIVFTTNQRTSRFAVADLLALVSEGDVFYLRHMDATEPTLLVIANDHSDLLNG